MSGAVRAHVTATRFAIDLCGDFAEDRGDDFIRFAGTARHERRTFKRPFFAAGNSTTDKVQAAPLQFFESTLCVGEKRIAAVNDDVASFKT
jgi:hypothetical protein